MAAEALARSARHSHPPFRAPDTTLRSLVSAAALAAIVPFVVMRATSDYGIPIGVFYDDATYVDLANSLAAGRGYRHGTLPGTPSAIHFPPLYPLWLALWSSLGALGGVRDPGVWLKLGNTLLIALASGLWMLWGTLRLRLSPWYAAIIASTSVLALPVRPYTSVLLSEPLAWVTLALVFLAARDQRLWSPIPKASEANPHLLSGVIAGRWLGSPSLTSMALGGLLPLVRTALIPYAFVLALAMALNRDATRGRRVAGVVLALAPSILWMLWVAVHANEIPAAWNGNYGSYLTLWLSGWTSVEQLAILLAMQTILLMRVAASYWGFAAPFGLVCLLIGLVRLARSQGWAAVGTAGYVAIVMLWPLRPDRLIIGILPLLGLTAAAGGLRLASRSVPYSRLRWLLIAALTLPPVVCARGALAGYQSRDWQVVQRHVVALYAPLVAWADSVRPREPVVTPSDGLFALSTGVSAAPGIQWVPGRAFQGPAPAAPALAASLCAVGDGWIALPDTGDGITHALLTLRTDPGGDIELGPELPVGGLARVIRFSCSRSRRAPVAR